MNRPKGEFYAENILFLISIHDVLGGGDKKVSSSRKQHGGQHEESDLPGESEEDHNQVS